MRRPQRTRRIARLFSRNERGATALEYGLIVGIITSGLILTVQGTTGERLKAVFLNLATSIAGEESAEDGDSEE